MSLTDKLLKKKKIEKPLSICSFNASILSTPTLEPLLTVLDNKITYLKGKKAGIPSGTVSTVLAQANASCLSALGNFFPQSS